MTPENLPDLYARVVAKRPELAVPNLKPIWDGRTPGWRHDIYDRMMTKDAAALILAKWVEALPVSKALRHHAAYKDIPEEWSVAGLSLFCKGVHTGPTPIEALAAFWMEYNPEPKESA